MTGHQEHAPPSAPETAAELRELIALLEPMASIPAGAGGWRIRKQLAELRAALERAELAEASAELAT